MGKFDVFWMVEEGIEVDILVYFFIDCLVLMFNNFVGLGRVVGDIFFDEMWVVVVVVVVYVVV